MDVLNNVLSFFITSAHADTALVSPTSAAAPQGAGNFSLVLMLGIFIVFMYFAVWRPQAKRAKEQRNLLDSLTKGDEVVTTGGILGKISKVADNYIVLALAENVEITVQKSSIAGALPKGTLKSI
jgi:preprotein translocase subunit YajC